MSIESNILDIVKMFIGECEVDYVGLWAILWEISRSFPEYNAAQSRETTLFVVDLMLNSGKVVIGDFDRMGHFVAWPVGNFSALERLRKAWDALEHEPDIGDLCWFTSMETIRTA